MEDSPETISTFKNVDIAVLRSGKAKKNDPPIPADLAPISGGGKRVRKTEEPEEKLFLDPIKFRYSTETVVDEPEVISEESLQESAEPKANRKRRRRGNGERAEQRQPEKKEPEKKPEPKPAEKTESAEGEQENKKPRRRPNYRRHRKNKPSGEG
jgi:hypothetical protein